MVDSGSLFVRLDPSSLRVHLSCSNPKLLTELRLLFGASSGLLEYRPDSIVIPWHEFIMGLVPTTRLLKAEGIALDLDDLSKRYVEAFLADRSRYRGSIRPPPLGRAEVEAILLERGVCRPLTPEQTRDLLTLLSLPHGANFSVPGAGKTATLLALHTVLKDLGEVDKLLVVAPLNAFISWEDEIRDMFMPPGPRIQRLTVHDLRGPRLLWDPLPDVAIVNYEKLRGDVGGLVPFLVQHHVHFVLDESHRIKAGSQNLSYSQIMRISDIAARRDVLSGTPMPQAAKDLVAQFKFLSANITLPDLDSAQDEEAAIQQVGVALTGRFVRTTKSELGLREPIVNHIPVQMGPVQSQLYELFRSEAARTLAGLDRGTLSFFRSVGRSTVRLLQAATNPMLLGTEDEYFDEVLPIGQGTAAWQLLAEFAKFEKPAKIEALKRRLRELLDRHPDNKVVVWSSFVRNILLLERLLSEYNPVTIYGAIPSGSEDDIAAREGRLRQFHNDPSCRVLIANPQAGGEGISLHRVCHFALYLDRTFNAAHYLQSVDRIHRLGLSKTDQTTVEILVARNSIDEILIDRLAKKTQNMARVLNDPGLMKLAYDPDDISPGEDQLGLDAEDVGIVEAHILGE